MDSYIFICPSYHNVESKKFIFFLSCSKCNKHYTNSNFYVLTLYLFDNRYTWMFSWHDHAMLHEQYHWKKAMQKKQPYKFSVCIYVYVCINTPKYYEFDRVFLINFLCVVEWKLEQRSSWFILLQLACLFPLRFSPSSAKYNLNNFVICNVRFCGLCKKFLVMWDCSGLNISKLIHF